MSDVFEEVEESLRSEKAQQTWSRYAPFVYGVASLIVLVVGGREYLSYRAQSAIDASAQSFERGLAAVEAGDSSAAKSSFQETLDAGGGYGALAAQYLADLELSARADAAAAADALSAGAREGGPLASLAILKAAYLRADDTSLETLEADLAPLLDEGGPFGALARELLAAKAHQSGNFVRARREYSVLTLELDVPSGVQRRAQIALSVIPIVAGDNAPLEEVQTPVEPEDAPVNEINEDDPS